MNTIILENWSTCGPRSPYLPSEAMSLHLHGEVYKHPRFEDGTVVTTSSIDRVNSRFVTTKSGSLYWLGKPDQEFVEWCKERGVHVPTELQPIMANNE